MTDLSELYKAYKFELMEPEQNEQDDIIDILCNELNNKTITIYALIVICLIQAFIIARRYRQEM